ncbi:MAG TPA: hypothetical protein VHE30_08425 [Polyangiaceae bacterium]|nr:hypothetical protein [Polyangiaceae bacterium]
MRSVRTLAAALGAVGLLLSPGEAHADVASWLFVGGGAGSLSRPGLDPKWAPVLHLDAGMGTSPANPLSVGGLFRLQTRFGDGSDYGLFLRTASGGYNRGDWGAALDLGGYLRPWGDEKPGYAATLSLGAPWGITLNTDFQQGPDSVRAIAFVVGLDLARFTAYRSTGLGWLPNPYPAPAASPR